MSDNPLIDFTGLPSFSNINAEHVKPAVEQLIADGRSKIKAVLEQPTTPTWATLVDVLDAEDDRLNKAFSPVSHLNGVAQTEVLREAYNACLPLLSEYGTEVGQNQALFEAYETLKQTSGEQLNQAQNKYLENTLRDFRLSGVALPEDKKALFMENSKRLSELSSQFANNVLDATQAWKKHITDADELAGMPAVALAGAADKAQEEGLEGWLLTLDFSCYLAVMSHVENRALREEMYHAFSTRASEQGPDAGKYDNSAIMNEILQLRSEQAQLLGFNNYAERSLATKMASNAEEVLSFLRGLASKAKPQAEKEFQELEAFAKEQGAPSLEPWDVSFWSERLREERYSISEEELRPWFPAEKVVHGMFHVVHQLFGINIRRKEGVDVWHPDVNYYEVFSEEDELLAGFYLDMYARTGKRGGAWMADMQVRRRLADGSVQLPVAFLTCNFAPPAGGKPGLLTHDEVVTLFHEFGHGLHHMLTEQEVSGVSGINGVPWDAVELPSQFMENWCWTPEGLAEISGHYETNQPLPAEMLEKMLAARNFQKGMFLVRQLEFGLFDFRIHHEYEQGLDIQQVLNEVRDEVAVVKPPATNRFQHGFSHIFAGGYAAGYYSYLWAEVLSADAFSRFEEEGVMNGEVGRDFRRCILAQGGSQEPLALFVQFRGREPQPEALLRHSGIAA
ncbi:MAG TPA: oligopeptidase A [Alcanivoracaceae bacterium]|nr:oligopeptidase A [Alcanivoracaceae bacterium]